EKTSFLCTSRTVLFVHRALIVTSRKINAPTEVLARIRDYVAVQRAGAAKIALSRCVAHWEHQKDNRGREIVAIVIQGKDLFFLACAFHFILNYVSASWGGVNCNVCLSNNSCTGLKGNNATCITTGIGLKSMNAWCDTTNIPWIDNTHVSLQCEWEKNECVFQFWKDSEEQFYCHLTECEQESK
ncbi:hypothetical protein INT44_002052, partial [Umbelopsis vinacea]